MKIAFTFLLALLSAKVFAEQFGAAISAEGLSGDRQPSSVAAAIAAAEAGKKTPVLVQGEVTSVCQAKGCWMGFSTEAGDVRVTFKDYGFFVPFSIVGKKVLVEGELEITELSLADSKHLVKDAGGDPDSVSEPIVEYRIVATGVKVLSS